MPLDPGDRGRVAPWLCFGSGWRGGAPHGALAARIRTRRGTPAVIAQARSPCTVLTYPEPTDSRGKSSADSDIVEARYVEIVPNDRVVQAVDFVSDDPAFAGTMTMTWAVRAVDGGTRVEVTADDVPDGISADDHAAGLTSSLDNLAGYVE